MDMRIKLVDRPSVSFSSGEDYRKRVLAIGGEWLHVETEHLFNDQFNCENENPAEFENGLRIYQSMVQDIENDVRIGAAKCLYCGLCLLDQDIDDGVIDCPRCYDKIYDGVVSYVQMSHLCVMDRLRPLWTFENGERRCVYNVRPWRKVKTPEGEIQVMGQPRQITERTRYRGL